jgi:hypothetical protein
VSPLHIVNAIVLIEHSLIPVGSDQPANGLESGIWNLKEGTATTIFDIEGALSVWRQRRRQGGMLGGFSELGDGEAPPLTD